VEVHFANWIHVQRILPVAVGSALRAGSDSHWVLLFRERPTTKGCGLGNAPERGKQAVDGHKMRSGSRPVTGSDAPSSAVASVDTAELMAQADLCRGLREGSLVRRRKKMRWVRED
jgi:hypothetical protein